MECQNSSESRRSCDSISILVVDDDTTCLSFVAALLKKFKYEVVTAKHPNDALCALRVKRRAFDLVVSDVYMPDMNGFQLQQLITHEFNLPVVLMSVDNKEGVVSKGMESGAALFISKPVSPSDLKDLWQFAAMTNKRKVMIEQGKNRVQAASVSRGENKKENSKRKVAASKKGSESECDVNTKKPKVRWKNGLQYRFLEAIRSIGLERSVPKKILQVMNVPGLTRENVASHLQKYRMFLKRVSDASYKVEVGDDSRSYSALTLINRLNKPQLFGASYQKEYHQYLQGDSCYVPNTQELSADFTGDYQHQMLLPPPPSNLALIQDIQNGGNIIGAVDEALNNPTHLPSAQLNMNILKQQQPQGCDQYTESSLLYDGMNNPSYDQAVFHQVPGSVDYIKFGSASSQISKALEECAEDDALESLLAFGPFGEDQIQTLEGI